MRFALACIIVAAACSGSSKPAAPPPTPPSDGSGSAADANCTDPKPAADSVCLQDCGPPVVRDTDPPPAWRWVTPADVENREKFGCPRCLPPDAMIATPRGDVPMSSLTAGAIVWSTDERGHRVAVPIIHVGSTPAPRAHTLIVVELSDRRIVRGSDGHPTADGRVLGSIIVGTMLDGARVTAVHREPFSGERTYDLLPAGATRAYWADGVLLTSTLRAD
jgi:hypothetical protein